MRQGHGRPVVALIVLSLLLLLLLGVASASQASVCARLEGAAQRQQRDSAPAQAALRSCVQSKCLRPGGGLPCARGCENAGVQRVVDALARQLPEKERPRPGQCVVTGVLLGGGDDGHGGVEQLKVMPLTPAELHERRWRNNIAGHCGQEVCVGSKHPLLCQQSCEKRHLRYKRFYLKCKNRGPCVGLRGATASQCVLGCVSRRIQRRLLRRKQMHRKIRALKYNAKITDARRRDLLVRAYNSAKRQADAAAKAAQAAAEEAERSAHVAATSRMEHLRSLASMRRQEAVVACSKHHLRSGRCAYLQHIIDKFGNDKYRYKGRGSERQEEQSRSKSPLSSRLERLAKWKDEGSGAVVEKGKRGEPEEKEKEDNGDDDEEEEDEEDEEQEEEEKAEGKSQKRPPSPEKARERPQQQEQEEEEEKGKPESEMGEEEEGEEEEEEEQAEQKREDIIRDREQKKLQALRNQKAAEKKSLKQKLEKRMAAAKSKEERQGLLEKFHSDVASLRQRFHARMKRTRQGKKFAVDLSRKKAALVGRTLRQKERARSAGRAEAKREVSRQRSLADLDRVKEGVERRALRAQRALKEAERHASKMTRKLKATKERIQRKGSKVEQRDKEATALRARLSKLKGKERKESQLARGDVAELRKVRAQRAKDGKEKSQLKLKDDAVSAEADRLASDLQSKAPEENKRSKATLQKRGKTLARLLAKKRALSKRASELEAQGKKDRAQRLQKKLQVVNKDVESAKSLIGELAAKRDVALTASKRLAVASSTIKKLQRQHQSLVKKESDVSSRLSTEQKRIADLSKKSKSEVEEVRELRAREGRVESALQEDEDFEVRDAERRGGLKQKLRRLKVATLRAKAEYSRALVRAQKAISELCALRKVQNPQQFVFQNGRKSDVLVTYINKRGEEVRFLMVPAGGKMDRLVQFRHPLVLRDAKSGDRIKVYLPTTSAKQVVRV